ncbi:MAG: branched-chain amino acid ABC transporter permease [bacterium]
MSLSLQQFINGIQKGSMYALIALGYTMVYGIIKLINFAHGDIFMVGVYLACFSGNFLFNQNIPYSFFIAMIVAMVGCMLLGIFIQKIAYQPLRDKPRLTMLITAIGVSLFLENFLALAPQSVPSPLKFIVFGPQFRKFPPLIEEKTIQICGIIFNNIKLIDLWIAILMMIILQYIVKYTMIGKAMRATAFNKDVAQLMGININYVIMVTFALGSGLAGIAGILYGLTYGVLQSPYLGLWPGIAAFVAAVVGGIGNIPGAMLGGFLMGIVETMALSINSNLGYVATFFLLVLVLLFKPTGLLGKPFVQKI